MKIGYARVSSSDQNIGEQLRALKVASCRWIFHERSTRSDQHRPELVRMLGSLKRGDVVVIQRLSYLGKSLQHLTQLIKYFEDRGIALVSLHDGLDTTTSQGKAIFPMIDIIARFDRELISGRTKDGLQVARNNGIKLGKRPGLSRKKQTIAKTVKLLYKNTKKPITAICQKLNISRSTFYRYAKL